MNGPRLQKEKEPVSNRLDPLAPPTLNVHPIA